MNIWSTFLYQPLVNGLIFFYNLLGGNLGLAIIALTVGIRLLLLPLTKPSLVAAQKMKEIAPELEKLKKKHKDNKQAFAQAQLQLYKKYGINPMAGCLPQIIQFIVLIALFQAFTQVLSSQAEGMEKLNQILYPPLKISATAINPRFLYLDLTKPDLFKLPFSLNLVVLKLNEFPGLFLLASVIIQFLSSKAMMPAQVKSQNQPKAESQGDMAQMMQSQMLYMMPLMTLIIGFRFPAGLVLYWLTFSLFMYLQQILQKPNAPQVLKKELVYGRKKR